MVFLAILIVLIFYVFPIVFRIRWEIKDKRKYDIRYELWKYYRESSTMTYDDFRDPISRAISRHLERQPNMQTQLYPSLEVSFCTDFDVAIVKDKVCFYLCIFELEPKMSDFYLRLCKCKLFSCRDVFEENGYDITHTRMEIITPTGVIPVTTKPPAYIHV